MNFESGFSQQGTTVGVVEADPVNRNRRNILIAVALIALLAIGAWFLFGQGSGEKAAGGGAGGGAKQAPTVSVVVPGRRAVERTIAATGNLAARRELPVGIAGEGGQVAQVLVEPGQWVSQGQVLATIDRRVQSQEAAALAAQTSAAAADVRLAESNLTRAQALVARGFISKADIDRLTATRDGARAQANVARARYQQSLASNSRLDIRAPAAGLVLERRIEPGQVVSAGSGVLFRLAKGGELELLARLGETDLARLAVGQRAQVTPVGGSQAFEGQIWQISPVIDPQTRQGVARVALSYNTALRPGGFAAARLVSGAVEVPLLPESAVQSDTVGSFVMIVGKDNKVVRRTVRVGDVNDSGVSILEGLSGQEPVVLSAGAFLNPGETVIPERVKLPG
ncbi:MAG: efflux RND transporter periplasmic adaptor subunit [Sphingomonadaceae bacterium]